MEVAFLTALNPWTFPSNAHFLLRYEETKKGRKSDELHNFATIKNLELPTAFNLWFDVIILFFLIRNVHTLNSNFWFKKGSKPKY